MANYSPFEVKLVNGALYGSPEQMYQILADFSLPNLSLYKVLFDKYGIDEGLLSLVDLVALIIRENEPNLLEHLDFDEESYQLDMHVNNEAALQEFESVVCPVFRDLEELKGYVRRIAGR